MLVGDGCLPRLGVVVEAVDGVVLVADPAPRFVAGAVVDSAASGAVVDSAAADSLGAGFRVAGFFAAGGAGLLVAGILAVVPDPVLAAAARPGAALVGGRRGARAGFSGVVGATSSGALTSPPEGEVPGRRWAPARGVDGRGLGERLDDEPRRGVFVPSESGVTLTTVSSPTATDSQLGVGAAQMADQMAGDNGPATATSRSENERQNAGQSRSWICILILHNDVAFTSSHG